MGNCQLRRALFRAVESGSIEDTRAVLDRMQRPAKETEGGGGGDGGDPALTLDLSFEQPPAGNTPLHLAAICGYTEIARLLLERGAEPDDADREGRTPMYVAAMGGHAEIVELLLATGKASVNARSHSGLTAYFVACWRNHGAIARRLMEHGADLFVVDDQGRSAWAIAREWSHTDLANEMEQCADRASHGFTLPGTEKCAPKAMEPHAAASSAPADEAAIAIDIDVNCKTDM